MVVKARSVIQALLTPSAPVTVDVPAPVPVIASAETVRLLDGTTVHLVNYPPPRWGALSRALSWFPTFI